MLATLTLGRIVKDDAAEAVRLYFEPLFKLLSWLRYRLFDAVENKEHDQLLTAVEILEGRGRDVEVLEWSAQFDYRLQKARLLREAPLILFKSIGPERLIRRDSLLAFTQSLVEYDTRFRSISKIMELFSTDAARIDALSSLLFIDFGHRALSSIVALRSSLDNVEPDMREVRVIGFSSFGRTELLHYLPKVREASGERRLLLEGIEQPKVPDIERQATRRFGIYLEVAAFLAQEGYEEAAVAVVARAFKLFRPREIINPTREAK